MTSQAQRPRRALTAALLCAGLAAASLPFAPGVAHAAADEVSIERLSGPTRYETAVAVAERYADTVSTDLSTAIVVPGADSHAACTLPAAAVAAQRQAPILLTPAGELPPAVESFITNHDIGHAVIVGGTAAVSVAVAGRLGQLTGRAPQRLGGSDCAQVALAVARHLGSAGVVAGRGRTALLATDVSTADGLAAGPVAYRGRLPLLLAHDGQLEAPVLDYLADDADHVIVLGGTAAVSEAAVRQIQALGLTTERWSGIDRYATATRIATELLGDRSPFPCFDGAELGLAFGGLSPDAIASGPLLGELCAPLLLVPSDAIPRSVASFLRSDDWVTGDKDNDLSVTVFGGTAVVPTDVVTQFFERATTLVPIGGRISVELEPENTADNFSARGFTVTFDSDIDAKKAERALESGVRMFSINSVPVRAASAPVCFASPPDPDEWCGDVRVRRNSVTVTLDQKHRDLKVEDVITVTGGQRIGSNNSPRPLARFSYIIPEPDEPVDRDAPEVEIIAPAGHNQIALLVIEANPLEPALLSLTELAGKFTVEAADGTEKGFSTDTGPVDGASGTRGLHKRYLLTLDGPLLLEPGDAITVPRGVFLDEGGRKNPLERHVVAARSIDFRIESITIGDVESDNPADVTLEARRTQQVALPTGTLTIAARRDGIASGSRGNEWRVYGVGLRPSDDEDEEPEVTDPVDCSEPDTDCLTVSLNRTTRLIRYDIVEGEPTFADLAEALSANSDFAANFTVSVSNVTEDSGTIGGTIAAGVQFSGGGTAVVVQVRFSDAVKALLVDAADPVNERVEVGPGLRYCSALPLLADIAPRFNASSNDKCTLGFVAPDNLVYLKLNSNSASRFPERGDSVFINGNAACSYPTTDNSCGRPNVAQGWLSIRYDPDVAVD